MRRPFAQNNSERHAENDNMMPGFLRTCTSMLLALIVAWGCSPIAALADDSSSDPSSSNSAESTSSDQGSSTDDRSTQDDSSSKSSSAVQLPWFIKSPELLKRLKDDQSSNPTSHSKTQSYDFTGSYKGMLTANAEWVEKYNTTIEATEPDQNAALAQQGGTLVFAGGKLDKLGDTQNNDDSNFYGINSIALAANAGSHLLIGNTILESKASGANALFATDNASLYANDNTIHTEGDYSRAIEASCGATIVADSINTETDGSYSSAVSAYRGGGNVSVANSTFETRGSASPILYSLGKIEAKNVVGSAGSSQFACINGPNSILIKDSELSATMMEATAEDPISNGFLLYQESLSSADSATSQTAVLQIEDSSLVNTIQSGALFYLTNTQAQVTLSNTKIEYDSESAKLLMATGNTATNWGNPGRNGAMATFTATNQKLRGDVEVDSISTVDLFLLNNSTWTGSADVLSNAAGATFSDNLTVNIDSNSTWVVTGNSKITNLNMSPGGRLVDERGRSIKIVDSNGFTVVDGASNISITISGGFSTTVKTSSSNDIVDFSLDRSDFNYMMGIDEQNESNRTALTPDEQRVDELMAAVRSWFANL